MTSFMKGNKVIRETKCPQVSHLYGEVIFWGYAKSGRLMIVCETPEGAFFISDPSHLEIVNANKKGTEGKPPPIREGSSHP